MQVICSWCGKSIKEKEPLWDKAISHTVCEVCFEKLFEEYHDKIKNEFEELKETLGGQKMKIQRAIKIAKREWGNIRVSLEKCGDIGEFDSKNPANSRLTPVEDLSLVMSLIEMENRLPKRGYFTPEAAYVFTNLASSAAERLGLIGRMAQTFGSGYSWVRTGWFGLSGIEDHHVIKEMIFFKLFFPDIEDLNWDFNSPEVKTRLKVVFDKFVTWQDKPKSYVKDAVKYKNQLESLFGSAYH